MRQIVLPVIICAIILNGSVVYSDDKLFDEWNEKAIKAYQAKDYSLAVDSARHALKVAEETFGATHNNVAEALDNLAIYDQAIGNYDEAEACYKRALAILEKNLPPDDHYLAIFMTYLADFYRRAGKPGEAAKLAERAKAIRAGTAAK